jgi:hypothetical protein
VGVTNGQIEALRPYLEGEQPGADGEWGLHCPLHEDHTRSASLNIFSSKWFCQVCEIGGVAEELMEMRDQWLAYAPGSSGTFTPPGTLSEAEVAGWASALMAEPTILNEFMERRGLGVEILQEYHIGYDAGWSAFTIPVRNANGDLVNVRRYQLDPDPRRRKIWSVKGHGQPYLYPMVQLDSDHLVVCEGEWDALATIQAGIPAITRTAAATVWDAKWSKLFAGKTVYLCHDRDNTGVVASKKVKAALLKYAREIRIVKLPFPIRIKHGQDLTDYWLEGHDESDFWALVEESRVEALNIAEDPEFASVSVLETFDANRVGRPLGMRVDVSGKRLPGYLLPEKLSYTCDQGAGAKCSGCPMKNEHSGHLETVIARSDPLMLKMLHVTEKQRNEELRLYIGAVKCGRMETEVTGYVTVEELYVRPAAEERHNAERADFTNRRILVVGHHDIQPNSTVDVTGTVLPSPKTAHNEFLSWDAIVPPNALDSYTITDGGRALCESFHPSPSQTSIAKVEEIAHDLSTHVTRILQRSELHVLLDLVWHSPLYFMWSGKPERSWLDVLIVGDTRTGKSEAASAMAAHYGLGEMVSCESASFAGIVGGLDKIDGDAWVVTWGLVPANDRGLVVLDEVSGLSTDQIAKMSSIRSSGLAELTKIRTERTMARTRLVMMGNPRDARMNDYTYGAQAIPPLIGNNEDVARFDLAFSLHTGDVSADTINRRPPVTDPPAYSAAACHELVKWVWTRKADQVLFSNDALETIHALAVDLGDRYVETPPLIQGANVRFKLARVAAALAGRTYSTDDSGELLLVTAAHVEDAFRLFHRLYENSSFGYADMSDQRAADLRATNAFLDEAINFINTHKGLKRFIKDKPTFKSKDMVDFAGFSSEEANGIMHNLYTMHVVHREGPLAKVEQEIMRKLREDPHEY